MIYARLACERSRGPGVQPLFAIIMPDINSKVRGLLVKGIKVLASQAGNASPTHMTNTTITPHCQINISSWTRLALYAHIKEMFWWIWLNR